MFAVACRRFFAVLLASAAVFALPTVSTHAADAAKPLRIVLIGDSTVTDHAGWGLGFKQFLTDQVECVNTSQGGRSSKSFINEGRLDRAIAEKGDYYLIQFGHNDEKPEEARHTDPATTFPQYMTRYIDAVRAIGAQPIFVTSLTRRNFAKDNSGKITSTLTPYVEAVKKLAAEKNVPVIDLHARSIELCEKIGSEKSFSFNPKVKADAKPDTTHLNGTGSVVFARLVIEDLRTLFPALAPVFRQTPLSENPIAPETHAADTIVSFDGSAAYTTVQAAIDAAPVNSTKPYVILIKPGHYQEHLVIPADKPFITLRGEEALGTVITGALNFKTPDATTGKPHSARSSATVLVQANDFTAENLTFENTTTREEKVQALAIYLDADRAALRYCRFLGWQDTVRADKGRSYFKICYIEGHVDFIYAAGTAVFDRCHIHAKADGYLTAASTPKENAFGYVFLDCQITTAPEVQRGVYLGRPWRPFAATAFIRCELPEKIHPEGWHNWGKAENETTARYSEYHNTGPGARPDARAKWAHQLTDAEAATYTIGTILHGSDSWNPR